MVEVFILHIVVKKNKKREIPGKELSTWKEIHGLCM